MSGLVQEVQPAYTEGALPGNLFECFEVWGRSPLSWSSPDVEAKSLSRNEGIAPGTETYKVIHTTTEDLEGFSRGINLKLFDAKYASPILHELVMQLFRLQDSEMDRAAIRMWYRNRSMDESVIIWQLIFDNHLYQGVLYSKVYDMRNDGDPFPLFECVVACKLVSEYPVLLTS